MGIMLVTNVFRHIMFNSALRKHPTISRHINLHNQKYSFNDKETVNNGNLVGKPIVDRGIYSSGK